jgi:hypothetical protein
MEEFQNKWKRGLKMEQNNKDNFKDVLIFIIFYFLGIISDVILEIIRGI